MKSTTSSRLLKINESIYQAVFRYSYGIKQSFLDSGQFVVEIFSILFGNHFCNTLPKRHTRSRQFGPRGGATAHHTKEKHSELGGKIVRARKYFCTVIWGLFWPFLKICSRYGFAQFKNQPGYHYTIVIEYIFSRGFQY